MGGYIRRSNFGLAAFATLLGLFLGSLCFGFEQLPQKDGKDFADWSESGRNKQDRGDYVGAVKDYTNSIELNPICVDALSGRGFCYMRLKQYENAAGDFRTITQKAPEAGGHRDLGDAFYRLGKYSQAIEQYTEAAKVNPDPVIFNRGLALLKLDRCRDAADDFSSIINRVPKCAPCFLNRAYSLDKLGSASNAAKDRAFAYRLDKTLKGQTITDIRTTATLGRSNGSIK